MIRPFLLGALILLGTLKLAWFHHDLSFADHIRELSHEIIDEIAEQSPSE